MTKALHIVNPFSNPFGGSEQRALQLYDRLRAHSDVSLWSTGEAHEDIAARYPVTGIDIQAGLRPGAGTLILVGAYFAAERWLGALRPQRIIYVYNTPSKMLFRKRLELAKTLTGVEPEIVYTSELGAAEIGLKGRIEKSPIDLQRFHPERRERWSRRDQSFAVGRHSRDVPEKHHGEDAGLYQALGAEGIRVRLMGATCLRERFAGQAGSIVELLPCGAEPPEDFLARLDCFYYRTSEEWPEAFGRVVAEAMASGLPVVCDRQVGAAGMISHGSDGFVVAGTDAALAAIRLLHGDPELRQKIGRNARLKAEAVYSSAYQQDLIDYYTA
ncbi:glycosyltransferase family 4 protein [Pelagibius sp.]|uniref:glycosyltransferase family 4 protein n=1 Tax=Pelagibius sp. TaxID=1931238 RepID=UPI0026135919|nr:glycosyltransferase family 4 protein [Pelagibius sp.]